MCEREAESVCDGAGAGRDEPRWIGLDVAEACRAGAHGNGTVDAFWEAWVRELQERGHTAVENARVSFHACQRIVFGLPRCRLMLTLEVRRGGGWSVTLHG